MSCVLFDCLDLVLSGEISDLNDCPPHLMCVDKAVSKPFFKPLNCPFPNSLVNPVQESRNIHDEPYRREEWTTDSL